MGVAERREREKEARRELILDVAKSLFEEKGFHDTTVDDIADAAELGKGTIYSYYSSKESIYFALLIRSLESLRDDLDSVLGEDIDVRGLVSMAARAIRRFHSERQGLSEIMLIQVDESWDQFPPRLVEEHQKTLMEVLNSIQRLLERTSRQSGHTLEDPLEAAAFFMALEVGLFAITRMAPPDLSDLVDEQKMYKLARRVILKGLIELEGDQT